MESNQTIYNSIGDRQLHAILKNFYNKIFSSDAISHLFTKTPKDEILDKQYCFLTQFLGGPQRYTEKYGAPRMRARHQPHKITAEAKDEWLKLMKEAIDESDIDIKLKSTLYECFPAVAAHMVNS